MKWIDLHSHLVPGVDDGSPDVEASIEAIERMDRAGVGTIVTTPHVSATELGRPDLAERRLDGIAAAWGRVLGAMDGRQGPRLALGTEILLDHPRPEVGDPRCRIDGGRYVLVEFPHALLPPDSEDALYHLRTQDVLPIVAHVERYNVGPAREAVWGEWRDAGAALQVNVASLVGRYGRRAREVAWQLLERGWVDLLGSDYHARGEPWIEEGVEALRERGAGEPLDLLYRRNPFRVLDGQDLLDVPPVERARDRAGDGVFGVLRRLARRDR